MQNFIVLGYVPGTRFQITFGSWLAIVTGIVATWLIMKYGQREISIDLHFEQLHASLKSWLSQPVIE